MPFYPFYCDCGHQTEACFSIKDSHVVVCKKCGKNMKKHFGKMIPAYHDVPFDSIEYDMPGKPFPYSTRGQLKKEAQRRGLEVDLGKRSRERFE